MNRISQLFEIEPSQWGLRGDPHLWKEMKEHLDLLEMPETAADLERALQSAFFQLTQREFDCLDPFLIERYESGGLSSGMVCPEFWKNTAFTLIVSRYNTFTGRNK
jgi:hypothetical protein